MNHKLDQLNKKYEAIQSESSDTSYEEEADESQIRHGTKGGYMEPAVDTTFNQMKTY